MKRSLILLLFSFSVSAQTFEGTSGKVYLSITKDPPKPPILSIVAGSVQFTDVNGNNCIDAGESCKIKFTVENSGLGEGLGLKASLSVKNYAAGLNYSAKTDISAIKVGQKLNVELPVTGTMNTAEGSAQFVIKIDEPNGFSSDPFELEVKTKAFVSPLVKVADYTVTSSATGTLQKKKPFDVQVLVQNVQYGTAENVNVALELPPNVLCLSGNENQNFSVLMPGETKEIIYSLIVNDLYNSSNLPLKIKLSERYGKYAENRTIDLQLNQSLSASKMVVESKTGLESKQEIKIASLGAEVDKNIPSAGTTFSNRYALVIGNEDYSSYQKDLSSEVNVDYAVNDAKIFAEYCRYTLGIPEKQIKLYTNATAGQMRQGLAWIQGLAKNEQGKAEVYFYYSGHGLPDEVTKEPYVIPVDVSGKNVTDGIKVSEVYQKLTEHPVKKATVFMDACFSGGARNQGLLAVKGIKIEPKESKISGNLVVFSSSSGEQSSAVYREKQHGYFTYFLLKKLQEPKGQVSYKELSEYLKTNVVKETLLSGKEQTPQVQVSPSVANDWETWTVK